MHFLKLLTILLVSVHADQTENPSSHEKTETQSATAKASSRGSFRMTKRNSIKTTDQENDQKDERQYVQRATVQQSALCTGIRKIVQCKDDVPESVCKEALIESGVQVVSDMSKTIFFAVCVDSEADAAMVAALTNVERVEDDPVRTFSVVEGSMVKRDLQACEQVTPYGIDMVKAPEFWSRYNGTQGAGIKVCVIDDGLDMSHEDIRDGDVSGSDTAGLVSPWSEDGTSHGTHVAGTIAAQDNGLGVVGVAPQASLHIVRVFDSADVFASDLIVAMKACADAGSNIISMSLGGPVDVLAERSFTRTLHNQGILLVASSGNEGDMKNEVSYPAAYDHVISVAAVDESRRVAEFSTFNAAVDIAAPGVRILSLGSSIGNQSLGTFGPGYLVFNGTSMAAPHVAGVAALLWSQFPDSNVTDIVEALLWSAQDLGSCGKDPLTGYGLVDAIAAAMYLEGDDSFVPENRTCILVNLSLTTDDFGLETMYQVTAVGDSYDFVYRGGPYPNGQRTTYIDTFTLPDGCYNLVWLDSNGDGNNETIFGIGNITLDYDGTRQVASDGLIGKSETFRFGSCDATSPPTASAAPTLAPVVAPAVTSPSPSADRCSLQEPTLTCDTAAGESLVQVSLTTDKHAYKDNSLFLLTLDDEFIWTVLPRQLNGNSQYLGEACLPDLALNCFGFLFFDESGNGFHDGGNLTLSLDGDVVLQILPGDPGDVLEEGFPATFWSHVFGSSCPTSSFNFRRAL